MVTHFSYVLFLWLSNDRLCCFQVPYQKRVASLFFSGSRFLLNPFRFAAKLNLRLAASFRLVAMGSKRPLFVSSTPDSPLEEMMADSSESLSLVIQSIRDDPMRIETMTVQELRTVLRDASIPARGRRKADLISALKCFIDELANDEIRQGEECPSSRAVDGTPARRKITDVVSYGHVLAVDTVPEASSFKKSKTVVGGKGYSGTKNVRVESEIITTEEVKSPDQTDKVSAEPWTVLAHKKPQKGWVPYNPRAMRPPPLSRDTKFVKLMSWNVNGLRALMKVEGFSALELAQREDFDVLCLQETKLQEKDVNSIQQSLIDGYKNSFWSCSFSKLGYSGTAIISRVKPLSVTYGLGIPDHDTEGRIVTAEFDSFYLLNTYVPNSGDGLKRLSYRITQWDPALSNYMKELEKSKPVILTGDLNCAHQEIDIYNPAGNKRSAGFTDEERESFGTNFLSEGFVDTFRRQHPGVVGYTYWGYRHGGRKTNRGWRLDYFLVSESIAERVHDSYIAPEVTGSDHCPIGLILKL